MCDAWLRRFTVLLAFAGVLFLCSPGHSDIEGESIDGSGVFRDTSGVSSTGQFTNAYQFNLPAARGRVAPSLFLAYDSSLTPGVAGVGWSLPLPVIERISRRKPDFADSDELAFNGADIVPICDVTPAGCDRLLNETMPSWAVGWRHFRLANEQTFVRLFWSPNRQTWRVQERSGILLELGFPLAYPGGGSEGTDQVTYGTDLGKILRWRLVRQFEFDEKGIANNVVVYDWRRKGKYGLTYLTDMFYLPVASKDSDVTADFAHHIHLEYEAHDFLFLANAPVWRATPDLRLKTLDVASKESPVDSRHQVRRYHFAYKTMLSRSYLVEIQLEGQCDSKESRVGDPPVSVLGPDTGCPRLPPTTFRYHNPAFNPIGVHRIYIPPPWSLGITRYSTSTATGCPI